nr:PREDICTED: putative receptor-like protein kinase At3g47110 [Daucus carota subsp. sativus]
MILSFLRSIIPLILILASISNVYAFLNNITDHQALLSVKASITAESLGVLRSWNDSIHFCSWNGITCSRRRQRVTTLNLSFQHLVGTLSPHIGNLSFLRRIDLYQNNFHGSVPTEISRLFRLQHLNLGSNSFEGGFPTNLSHCVDIRYINMYANHLQGKIPTKFASWHKLDFFALSTNHFIGSIPPSIGNTSSLRVLYLDHNYLAGGIPLEVAHLAKLGDLDLSVNLLSGMICASPFLRLKEFYIGENRFLGPLPPSMANASNLVIFDIAANNITGPVPNNFGSLRNLKWLNLGFNPLGVNQQPNDLGFINSLVNCTSLCYLNINGNGLTGDLPSSIVNLSITMTELHMYGNHIYGKIPSEIVKLVNMTVLELAYNFLTGSIPDSIGELPNLGKLDLGSNNISGAIPTSISNITQLVALNLESNMLQGSIPTGLLNISTLEVLSLGDNNLGGVITEEIVGNSSQCVFLYLNQNFFSGPLPSNIGRLKHLVQLNVSNNKLTGDIPATLGDCVMLEELYMQGNLFEGEIPLSLKSLKSLALLDLSNNNVSGSIPGFIKGFHLIKFLNLSHNTLEGEVPKDGLFSNMSAFSVLGNSLLCGGIQALDLPRCQVKISRNKRKTFSLRIILLLVLLPLGSLFVCLAFIFYQYRKSKKMNGSVAVLHDQQFPRLSYQDLLLATNEFSPGNLIGEGKYGSVYKGLLESPTRTVAVKVLNVEVRGASKSFLAECETLRNIRHRNLIKIMTACSSTDFKGNDFKALVFEFLINGSLDNWLHPGPYQENERNLTLLQRLDISIDIAMGVDYLHHHSHTSIIHCVIKPSNILLDEEFVARVSDIGLARFSFFNTSNINQAQSSSTGVRGTVGYVPPGNF